MDNPKVSIIVPIYRVEEYIERCAESLFAQTFDDIEYIFVDDCSPDKSVEILQRTLEKYPHRKRLTRIERLSGGRAARPPGARPRGSGGGWWGGFTWATWGWLARNSTTFLVFST